MSIYIVARINIRDRAEYANYEAGFLEVFSRYAGKMLSVEEAPEVLEGEWSCTRTVLIEFPGKEDALAWYRSEEYQTLAAHRYAASTADIALLAGLPG